MNKKTTQLFLKRSLGVLVMLFGFTIYQADAQLAMTRSTFTGGFTVLSTGSGALIAAGAQGDDVAAANLPIGFTFTYLGTPYTTFNMCSNGFMNFGTSASSAANSYLATTTAPAAALAPWWDDLSTSSALYQTSGAPGSQVLTVQWTSLSYFTTSTRTMVYEVKLYEATGVIEFLYSGITGTNSNAYTSESASIGIKNATGGPGNYIDAVSGSSFICNGMLNSTQFPSLNYRFTPGAPTAIAAGTYNVGSGQVYTTLTEAIADVNHRGISGAVTLNLTDANYTEKASSGNETFPLAFGPVAGTSVSNTLTLQGNGANLRYSGAVAGSWANGSATGTMFASANGEPILGISGTDYCTINNLSLTALSGVIIGTGTGTPVRVRRGLAVQNNNATNGATNNTFSNLIITLDRTQAGTMGIDQGQTVAPSSQSGCNDNNTYKNFTIKNSYTGISMGTNGTTYFDNNNTITSSACGTYNIIGDPATPNDIGNTSSTNAIYGIKATYQSNLTINNTKIQNLTGTSSGALEGIIVGAVTTSNAVSLGTINVSNNIISSITSNNNTVVVAGIRANTNTNAGSVIRLYNNWVYGLNNSTATTTANRRIIGIRVQDGGVGTGSIRTEFNTVSLAPSGLNVSNTCYEIGTTSGAVLITRDNIFSNSTAAQSGATKHYTWVSTAAASMGSAGSVSNYNDLYVGNTANGYVGLGNATDYATLANWQTAMSADANSFSVDPGFASAYDLHISNLTLNGTADPNVATNTPWVTGDIDCQTRPLPLATNFDMGADEAQACNLVTAGSASAPAAKCLNLPLALSLTGNSSDAGTIIQWQQNYNGGGFVNIAGATAASYTVPANTLAAGTYVFQAVLTCSVSLNTATSNTASTTVYALPTVAVTPASGNYCYPSGAAVSLTASGAGTYAWSPASGLSATTGANVSASPGTTTTYTVTGTDVNSCTNTATATVSSNPAVTVNSISATPATVCAGGSSTLAASATAINYTAPVTQYTMTPSGGAFTSIVGTTGAVNVSAVQADEAISVDLPLGFSFNYGGTAYTTVRASSNGYLSFQTAAANSLTNGLNTSTVRSVVAPLWDDLDGASAGTATYVTTGTAPNRVFTFEWLNFEWNYLVNAATISFQAKLYEADGKIDFVYRQEAAAASSASASIGLSGPAAGQFFSLDNSSASPTTSTSTEIVTIATKPATGQVYTFRKPTNAISSYAWTESPNNGTIANPNANPAMASNINTTTTYTVTATAGGCSASANVTVTAGAVLACGTLSTGGATTCAGVQTLSANPTGGGLPYSYSWTQDGLAFGGNTATITTTAGSHLYAVSVTDNCAANCTTSMTVVTATAPTVTVTPASAAYCAPGAGVSVTAAGASTYSWSPAGGLSATTGATVVATPSANTTYTVTGTDVNGCTNTATSTINSSVAVTITSISATPATVCAGGSSTLAASATAINYTAPVTQYTMTPSGGTFTSIVGTTGAVNVSAVQADEAISVDLPLGFSFNYGGTAYTTVRASSNGYLSFQTAAANSLTNGLNTSTVRSVVAPLWDDLDGASAGTATYVTTGTAPNRVFTFEWLNFEWNYLVNAATISFQAKLYEADGKIDFVYRQEAAAASSASASIGLSGPAAGQFFSLDNSSASPTTSTSTEIVTIAAKPATGQVYTFRKPTNPVTNFAWTESPNNSTLVNAAANPATANNINTSTVYTVTASAAGCSASGNVTVAAGSPLSAGTVGTTGTPCTGFQFVTASPSGGGLPYSYTWTEDGNPFGGNTASLATSAGTHTYAVTVTDNCGASATTPGVAVTTNSAPAVAVSPNSATYCAPGAGVSLTASGAATYSWSPAGGLSAATGATVTAAPSANTTYTVTGTDGNGCTNTATATINSSVAVTVSGVTASPAAVCAGGSSTLTATATAINFTAPITQYVMTPSGGTFTPLTGATTVPAVQADEAISVDLPLGFSFNYGGTAYTTVRASSNGYLSFQTAAANSLTNGLNTSTVRSVVAPLWDDLDGASAGTASYITTGTAPNRVFTFEWLNFEWNYLVNAATISFQAKLYEADGKIDFVYRQEAAAAATTSASIGLSGPTAGQFLSLNNSSASPTTSTATETVTIATKPATGQVYTFRKPTNPVTNFAWTESPNNSTLVNASVNPATANNINTTTTYTVTASAAGCSATGNVTVSSAVTLSAAPAAAPATVCSGSSTTLTANASGGGAPYTYSWSDGASVVSAAASFSASPVGNTAYTLTVSDNCSNSYTAPGVLVTVAPHPAVSVTPNTGVVCNPAGTAVNLAASSTGGTGTVTYAWAPTTGLTPSAGASVAALPAATTTYVVTGTDANNCTGTASAVITIGTAISVTVSATPTQICQGSSSALSAVVSGNGSYCTPTLGFPDDLEDYISNVTFAGVNNTSTTASGKYQNFTSGAAANVVAGSSYPISISAGWNGSSVQWTEGMRAWIDFNKNGTFEASESVYATTATGTSPFTATGTVLIPATALNGATRMRVGLQFSSATGPAATASCTGVGFGEYEDYTINITGGASFTYAWTPTATLNNAAIANPTATPTTPGANTYNVTVTSGEGCTATGSAAVTMNATGQWLGITNSWNTATNWCGGVPTASSDVLIPAVGGTVAFAPHVLNGNTGNARNITLNDGAMTIDNGGTVNLYGDVTMNPGGTFDAAGGNVNFNAATPQNILPGFTVANMTVSGGANKTLNGNVTVSNSLILGSGNVVLNGNDLTMSPGATVSGASATSYVQTTGAGSELRQTVTGTPVFFPVGSGTYDPATLANTGTADVFAAHVRDEVLDGGTGGSQVDNEQAVNHTWDFSHAAPASPINVTMSLQWHTGETINNFDYSHVFIAHYTDTGAGPEWVNTSGTAAFQDPAATSLGGGYYSVTQGGITSLSPFTVSSAGSNPLPVRLLDLAAVNAGSRNKVEWHSASEQNLARYEVEQSVDGRTFVHMDNVAAQGKAWGYITYDNSPAAGLNYYRLKMVDNSGSFVYSQVVRVFVKGNGAFGMQAYPNPVSDKLAVEVYGGAAAAVLQLTDVTGRVLRSLDAGTGLVEVDMSGLAAGVYFVKYADGLHSETIKVNKQ